MRVLRGMNKMRALRREIPEATQSLQLKDREFPLKKGHEKSGKNQKRATGKAGKAGLIVNVIRMLI